ncbi:MAG TPA: M43 family zinc metalloprotease, partial [Flavobacteriales bacterium]|nr:M43 family zinc metalloprotease [Flavobacteriales bacterium]
LSFFSFKASISQNDLKYCGADELRISTLRTNPKIAEAVIKRDKELSAHTRAWERSHTGHTRSATYTIPIVFHVIHQWGTENISDAQILDGLSILNKTFRKQLADTGSIVAAFKPIHADCDIEFALAQIDPDGNCTRGINRIASPLTTVGDHSVKSLVQWPPDKYLNVYIVKNAAGLAGHCVWPADADTIPAWDGIVIAYDYVGSIGTSTYMKSVAFAHECGHYLNLHHIWGGNNVPGFYYLPCDDTANCSSSDSVADTPPTKGWVTCNLTGASCGNAVDNVQNTMDYSYCNRMFTYGQKTRMQACLNSPIAGRNNLWTPANLAATGVYQNNLCAADFISDKQVVCESSLNTVAFTDVSYNDTVVSRVWTFPGGTPSASTAANPSVTYTTPGKYDVILKVYTDNDSATVTKTNFISVLPDSGNPFPFTEGFETTVSLDGLQWFENSFDASNRFELTGTAYSGSSCVMLDNFNNPLGTKDELISEVIDLSGATGTIYVSFKYAYALKDSAVNDDKLQVYATNNCNSPWSPRANIISPALETAAPVSTAFIPSGTGDWKTGIASIPSTYFTNDFRFKFIFYSNGGNNVYIDDINLSYTAGITEPSALDMPLNVFPNPSSGEISLDFMLDQPKRLAMQVVDLLGKVMYNQGETTYEPGVHSVKIDLGACSSGIYLLKVTNGRFSINKPLMLKKD